MGGASIVFGALAVFIASEKSFLHLSRNARRIFWYLFSCALTVWIVRWVHSLEGLGMAWVMLSATLAASVVEDEVSKKLGLTMLNIEATQRLRSQLRSPEAQGKAERVMDIVTSITRGRGYTLGTKQLVSRVSGTTARLQRALHRVLDQADAEELNYLLCTINCPAMVEVCSRETMELLVQQRLPELQTITRAVLVDALQKLGLRYRPRRQSWARDVLLNTRGLQLTYLKCYLDDGGDFHSTYKLMSHDLQGQVQQEVAEHLKAEGQAVAAEFRRFSSSPGVMLKVVSDIDDTLFSSGGSWPAGIDNRYPKKCYYPGALALYTELDRCFAEKHHKALQRLAAAEASDYAVTPVPEEEVLGDEPEAGSGELHATTPPIPVPAARNLEAASLPRVELEQAEQAPLVSPWQQMAQQPRREESLPLSTRTSSSATEVSSVGGSTWGESSIAANGGSTVKAGRSALTSSLTSRLRPLQVPRPDPSASSRPLPTPEPKLHTHQEGSNLVFLSARPESYKGLTEAEAYSKYFQPLVGRELRTAPSMLTGSLSSGPKALLHYVLGWAPPEVQDNPRTASSALFQTLAAKKLSRFRDFAAAWPECCFLFIGDNGQGDVLCAEVLWSSMRQGQGGDKSRLLACLIHRVAPMSQTYSMVRSKAGNKATWITTWKQRNIHFSKSHVGIAVQTFTLGLLDVIGLHRVCAAAIMDFRRIWARYSGRHAGRHLVRALHHLQKDLRTAQFYLPADLPLPQLMLPETASEQMATATLLPPPSPARSVLGTSPPVAFHREYGYIANEAQG